MLSSFNLIWPYILNDLEYTSTPGHCAFSRYGATNGEALGYDCLRQCVSAEREAKLRQMVWARINEPSFSDPIKLFIKPEPHKISKLQDRRYRLISSVSLIDQCVDKFLFLPLASRIQKVAYQMKTPVFIAWSPLKGGHYLLARRFSDVTKYVCIDKSAWDWSVPEWMIKLILVVLKRLAIDAPEWWHELVDARFECLFGNPEYVFSDFGRVIQPVRGIIKSGCYLTIIINSIGQILLHAAACYTNNTPEVLPTLRAVLGDDSCQEYFDGVEAYVSTVEKFGFSCKVQVLDHLDFAGFYYLDGKFFPSYVSKHLFKLRHLSNDDYIARMTLLNFQLLYVNEPEMLALVRAIAEVRGYPDVIVPDVRLLAIANG